MLSIIENIAMFSVNGKVLSKSKNIIKKIGEKNMSKCNCVIRATEITLRNGTYTVTLPEGSLTNLCQCESVNIGIYTSVPVDSTCNLVEITDGTNVMSVYVVERCPYGGCVADLWRTTLNCRTILCLKYAGGCDALTIQDVKGRRGC